MAAVFLAALVVRLWVLCRAADTPEFLPDQGDMKFYNDWARRIAGGMLTDHRAFYGLPGYAYFLAAIYKVVGFEPYVAALFQVITEAFTATIIFRLAPLAFGRHGEPDDSRSLTLMGVVAALGWVFFVPAQAYGTVLMPTVYLIAAFWFVVWWTLRRRVVRPSVGKFFALGLLAGVVAMMVANILFLIPLVLAAIWLRHEWGTPYARLSRAVRGCWLRRRCWSAWVWVSCRARCIIMCWRASRSCFPHTAASISSSATTHRPTAIRRFPRRCTRISRGC